MVPSDEGNQRTKRARDTTRYDMVIAQEHQTDKKGNLIEPKTQRPRLQPSKRRRTKPSDNVSDDDMEDGDFEAGGSSDVESGDGGSDVDMVGHSDLEVITNDELADILPSKTIPSNVAKSRLRQTAPTTRKRAPVTVEDVVDEDLATVPSPAISSVPDGRTGVTAPSTTSNTTTSRSSEGKKRNPIYYFYEEVSCDASGTQVEGNVYWKCYHGNRKVLTVTKAMRSNLNGLVNNLRHFPDMYRLYEVLKARMQPASETEKSIAAGKSPLSAIESANYLRQLEESSENIKKAFANQRAKALGPFDPEVLADRIAKWAAACDQPFDEVEKPEFIDMIMYAHHGHSELKIPGRHAIKRRIMKMGEDTIEEIKNMFTKLEGKVSISLDAWTSSNQHAFLAIVAHYVTNDGELEELLIDFRELIGEHSGDNMADAVWETLELYGLTRRVIAFVMDNATNNDTMVQAIEKRCKEEKIPFSASEARLRCLPHTIHLAALKLLEAIGAISKADKKKAASRAGNYQEDVTVSLSRQADDEAVNRDECEDSRDTGHSESSNLGEEVLTAVGKLRAIVKAVRSSPQRRQAWFKEISVTMTFENDDSPAISALMLILDVRTRWSSTHQMLRRALKYRSVIDSFVGRHRELRPYDLSEGDWASIKLVSDWLKSFREATTQMSATKSPMLSTTHAIFRGLQDDLKNILRSLPDNVDDKIKAGLTEAHEKLSDYYYKYDESPYYTWAALLDPRISFKAMKEDYADDPLLEEYLKDSISDLRDHYQLYYANKHVAPQQPTAPQRMSSTGSSQSSPRKDFTARYQKRTPVIRDELDEYIKTTDQPEDFETCNPIKWWVGRRAQFPNLFCLARDILSIPGSAVAVERIFSGGRDTISLRRASLDANTIRILMLVKKKLHLARAQAKSGSKQLYISVE